MNIKELKQKSRQQLGNQIFANAWLLVGVAILIVDVITSALSFTVVGSLLVIGPLTFGLTRLLVNNARGKGVALIDLFTGFTDSFGNALVTWILESVFTFLWFLLLVIPGIIKSYSYAMTFYILQDNPDMGANDAITESRKMMNGHKLDLFLLDLSFIGWYILGALCFGIGLFFVVPYHYQAKANFYESIKNN